MRERTKKLAETEEIRLRSQAAARHRAPKLLQEAHQIGGGFCGSLDFGEAANAGTRVTDMLLEHIRVRGDNAEKIIESVRYGLSLVGTGGSAIGEIERELHLRGLSKMTVGFVIGETGEDRGVKIFGRKGLEGDTARSPDFFGFRIEFVHPGGIEGKNGKRGILGANLINIVEALKVPGVNVQHDGVPLASGQNEKQLIQ